MHEELVTGEVRSLAFGGQGILRHDGFVVFVPFTAPGDTIQARIVRKKKSFAEGALVDVAKAGPARIKPRCPYFGQCGGCQLQHLTYAEQIHQKQLFVKDALQRIGGFTGLDDVPIVPAVEQWAYRRHIRLTLQSAVVGGYEAGYVREDLSGVLPVTQCPIFIEPTDTLLIEVQKLVSKLAPVDKEGAHVSAIKAKPNQFCLLFQFVDEIPGNIEGLLRQWLPTQRDRVCGAAVQGRLRSFQLGDCEGVFDAMGLSIKFSPLAFVQCHPEQSLNLYQEVLRLARLCRATSMLDLYCGIGVTSLLLAREGCLVTGVESNPEAVSMAMRNGQDNGLKEVQFLTADVARILQGLVTRLQPELVIVNPPRTGLDPTARDRLIQGAIKNLIYVSCMPATLARDLAAFRERGFVLTSCRAYDMFPQTTHVETVAFMQRGAS